MSIPILVIDDEQDMQDLIRIRFRPDIRQGKYTFSYAQDGLQALEKLQQQPETGLILCDINMPHMNGLEFLEKLKGMALETKVIMVTAYGNMENIRSAMNGGAFDFINKPIDFQDLKMTIDKAIAEATRLREAQAERARLLTIDQLKNHYFTNISHEFRTPLTIIDGMASQIHEKPQEWAEKGSHLIRRNTQRLIQLVNEILDLRKLKHGKLKVHWVQADVIAFFDNLINDSLQTYAKRQGIQLLLNTEADNMLMDIDEAKLQSIALNLISNAIKYTPAGGQVTISLSRSAGHFQLGISDTGVGISAENLPHIFDRFFQTDERAAYGSGIGLALTRELVQLLGGAISVTSEAGKGSHFQVTLPIHNQAPLEQSQPSFQTFALEDPMEMGQQLEQLASAENDLPRLLIVEDNADIVQYLTALLQDSYQLMTASNGREGIALATAHIPDIIISDVMMPDTDGYELCRTLKSDERTDHIPIILLTAKADQEARETGLGLGADAYLAKPFERQELMIRLEQLILLRKKLQERFHQGMEASPSAAPRSQPFIQKCADIVREHIDDAEFSVPELAQRLGLSRSQLYRKIKALTDLSTSMFIQHVRLDKANELILQSDLNISEIAYITGFSTPNYFSNLYKEKFGIAPRDRRAS